MWLPFSRTFFWTILRYHMKDAQFGTSFFWRSSTHLSLNSKLYYRWWFHICFKYWIAISWRFHVYLPHVWFFNTGQTCQTSWPTFTGLRSPTTGPQICAQLPQQRSEHFFTSPMGPKRTRSPYNQSTDMSKYMGVSKNSDTPKWMVYNGKPY